MRLGKLFVWIVASVSFVAFTSCNSNDDFDEEFSKEITITDDVDCCSADEALRVFKFLRTVKNVPELTREIDGKYKVYGYTKTGTFHVGYNEVYFVATKIGTDNYVKDFDITAISPLMTMASGMKHSTPVSGDSQLNTQDVPVVRQAWVSFLMASGSMGNWQLNYDIRVLQAKDAFSTQIDVKALGDGQNWLKSFEADGKTFYLSLVNPLDWKTGTNSIRAVISQKADKATDPYLPAKKQFSIEFVPTMPSMGYHSSPDNVPLTLQADGTYEGTVNVTMTGLWRLHLTVKDDKGNIVAGGDDLDGGYSSLNWEVTL